MLNAAIFCHSVTLHYI